MKKEKKKKLDSVPKINRKLFKLWSEAVRERSNKTCEFCSIKSGEKNPNGKPTKIDAHHLLSRDVKNSPLKFDILNGIAVCPFCHKFGMPSFHRDPITTITWLIKNRLERYEYVVNNSTVRIDLDNRLVLEEIKKCLENKQSLDIKKLQEIEAQFPKIVKKRDTSSLFEKDSSSSSFN